VTKTAWYWHKNRYEDQWNRIEDTEIKQCNYSYLIFNKGAKNIREKRAFFNKWCYKDWLSICRRQKLDPSRPIQKSTTNGSKILM
jgi:hypothetical protein